MYLEYSAGLGLQIQPLANFGKANAAWSTCKANGNRTCTKLRELLDAMIALGSSRGTFTAWEHFFAFEGGAPPWMSGMARRADRAGHSPARWLVPFSDTGTWSLYSLNGPPSTVEYHTLLRDILSNLCRRIGTDVYCTAADRVTQYLNARPA